MPWRVINSTPISPIVAMNHFFPLIVVQLSMNYKVIYTKKAEKDLEEYQCAGSEEELRKIKELTAELCDHPESGEGKVEELHYESPDEYSRRVSHEDRMVYRIDRENHTDTILSLRGHYSDH